MRKLVGHLEADPSSLAIRPFGDCAIGALLIAGQLFDEFINA